MTRLIEILKRCEAATPGPWECEYETCDCTLDYACNHPPYAYGFKHAHPTDLVSNDFEFIAHARQDLPLVVQTLQKAVEVLKQIDITRPSSMTDAELQLFGIETHLSQTLAEIKTLLGEK